MAQLNCFNQQMVMDSLLADTRYNVLLLQEAWANPHTLKIPTHPSWHDIMPYNYHTKNYHEKTHTCVCHNTSLLGK
ncbi:hypothetical protein CROQUDRAFT_43881 [Cronartium quercuum f. sp. fusiforme G11]|uniref:Endonuclease/exonuclease/phosphatase domain-containing protein n=1 Tax=Cronartium quercuum f. sp. fusiforme G11 TaxID=708437 RepID=A0A9P6TCK2_9BASI|nr:hypothetical protein CROQUDRAFT_43881 [Cronartium quercuum f. sp. fusiforme G11]